MLPHRAAAFALAGRTTAAGTHPATAHALLARTHLGGDLEPERDGDNESQKRERGIGGAEAEAAADVVRVPRTADRSDGREREDERDDRLHDFAPHAGAGAGSARHRKGGGRRTQRAYTHREEVQRAAASSTVRPQLKLD